MNTAEQDRNYSKAFHFVIDSGLWAEMLPIEKAVYLVLLRHVDDRTRNCWPGNDIIAKEAGIHEKKVGRATDGICNKWHLGKKWRKDRKNFYHLYTEKKFMVLHPQYMDISPSVKHKKQFVRSRDNKGRFRQPCNMERPIPQDMENQGPYKMEPDSPQNMDNKKNYTKKKQKEESIKNKQASVGSASACSQSQASPSSLDSYRGYTVKTQSELNFLIRYYKQGLIGLIKAGETKLAEGVDLDEAINASKSP